MHKYLGKPSLWIGIALLLAAWLLWSPPTHSPLPASATTSTQSVESEPLADLPGDGRVVAPATAPNDVRPTALPAFLPQEARDTITLILHDGPYPYRQDDGTFGNREGHLPDRAHGYYREYTVDTPGLSHRGARRIVTGGDPPEAWYYTDDHYDSFRAFHVDSQARQ